jgi:hypothetical protein
MGEGRPHEPAFATRASLEAMEKFAQLPLEKRREIYVELQKCATRQEVLDRVISLEAKYPPAAK